MNIFFVLGFSLIVIAVLYKLVKTLAGSDEQPPDKID